MVLRVEYDKGKVTSTPCEWKDALPHRNESKILCLNVGNTSYRWAMHRGLQENFTPCVFWRTPPVTQEEMTEFEPSVVLGSHIPAQIHKEVFGENKDGLVPASKAKANAYAAAQGTPSWTIYIVSTNRDHERGVLFLFSELVCRVFRLENTDFFSKEDGCYATLGVDRAACLFSGYKSGFHPLLVMDAGTAWTYTGLDNKGKIMGGGISPGLGARFRCLSDYCGKLPIIDHRDYEHILSMIDDKKSGPLPTFATDTKLAMITSIFQEVSGHCRNIIQQFLAQLKERQATEEPKEQGEEQKETEQSKPAVIITGGDASCLLRLLTKPGTYFPEQEGRKLSQEDIELMETKHLSAYGIGNLIQTKMSALPPQAEEEKLRTLLVGQRVAKKFEVPDLDGDLVYRGSIVQVLAGKEGVESDLFTVRYDDGDGEELALSELYDALKLYTQLGEKVSADALIWTEKRQIERKQGAEASAEELLKEVPALKYISKPIEVPPPAEIPTPEEPAKDVPDTPAEQAKPVVQVETPAAASASSEAKDDVLTGNSKRSRDTSNSSQKQRGKSKKMKETKEKVTPGKQYLKMPVAKYFSLENEKGQMEDVLYIGKVVKYDRKSNYWHIVYEDGDEEDFDEDDLKKGLALHREKAPGVAKEAGAASDLGNFV